MRPLRVALVSVADPSSADESSAALPFGYGARRVQAALLEPRVAGVEVSYLEARSPDPDSLAAELERIDPDLIGASAYIWSFPTLAEVARRAKLARPERVIVFGGPSARPVMFSLGPFRAAADAVDVLVDGEGEGPMRDIVDVLGHGRPLSDVPGLYLRVGGAFRPTGQRAPVPLDEFPSPYRLGLTPRGATACLETYRGCPLECTFCEWGAYKLAKEARTERALVAELRALEALEVPEVFLVDAALNLNRRALRSLVAAEAEVGLFARVPLSCEVYATHLREEDYAFLSRCRTRRMGVGLQSFNPRVLGEAKRPFDAARFVEGVTRLAEVAPATIEIILGLPGDDPASFRETLRRALELPCRNVHVFHCLVLPEGLMTRAAPGADMDYDPLTLRMRSCRGFRPQDFEELHSELEALVRERGGVAHEDGWEIDVRADQK